MGNIIILDLITLDFINPYLFILHAYPFFINDFNIFNTNYSIILSSSNIIQILNFDILNLNNIIDLKICKFFLSFNRTEFPLVFLCIYLFILIISITSKIKLYWELKIFIRNIIIFLRNIIIFLKRYNFKKLYLYFSYFYWNFFYLILFWVRKNTWNRLNFRSLELKKRKILNIINYNI